MHSSRTALLRKVTVSNYVVKSAITTAVREITSGISKPVLERLGLGAHVYVPNALFRDIGNLFSSGRGSFLALSAAGHAGGAACTPRRKCGSRPGSAARALGVKNCAFRQVITGSLFTSPSLTGQWKPHNIRAGPT